jgi:cytochrome c-type biogenesis protein CcmH
VRSRPALAAWTTALTLLALAALPAGALAATCPQTSVADIEDEVMCPVCKTPLGLAQEAPQADRQRAFILARVERCESKQQIKAALAAEFGDEVLAVPEDEGFDLAAYVVPGVALVAGIGACALAVARWRRRRPALAEGAEGRHAQAGEKHARREGGRGPDPAASARLERDLERYDL